MSETNTLHRRGITITPTEYANEKDDPNERNRLSTDGANFGLKPCRCGENKMVWPHSRFIGGKSKWRAAFVECLACSFGDKLTRTSDFVYAEEEGGGSIERQIQAEADAIAAWNRGEVQP